ncbi:Uncharacterized protein QTN25_010208 [Entamoeba marina]
MADFLIGEHCWCRLTTPMGNLPWPSIINDIIDQRIVIIEALGTNKLFVILKSLLTYRIKTKVDWIDHGYVSSSRIVMGIATKMNLDKQVVNALYDGLKRFGEGLVINISIINEVDEYFAEIELPMDMERFWLMKTNEMISLKRQMDINPLR